MPVAYDDIFTDGATDLTAGAAWTDNKLVLLADQDQSITTNLDVSGVGTVDLVHILGGAPRIASASGGTWTVKLDAAATTYPNFVWRAGGYERVTFSTNACTLAVIDGGEHVIAGGTVTTLVVHSGLVTIESGATVGTLILNGGRVKTYAAIATVHQSGGVLDAEARIGATSYTLSGGDGHVYNISGSACTILNLEKAGRFHPKAGNVATLNRRSGSINYAAAVRSLTLGSTAFNNFGGETPSSTGYITVSNLVNYVEYAGASHSPPPG